MSHNKSLTTRSIAADDTNILRVCHCNHAVVRVEVGQDLEFAIFDEGHHELDLTDTDFGFKLQPPTQAQVTRTD